MNKPFSYDSPVWQLLGRVGDAFILTILFVLTSVPIFTLGASLTTVYYVALKLAENMDEPLIPMYFKAFKKLFKESLIVSLPVVFAGELMAFIGLYLLKVRPKGAEVIIGIYLIVALLYAFFVNYFFPVLARCATDFAGYYRNAFYLSVKYFSWSILLLVIPVCIYAVGIFVFWPLLLFSQGAALIQCIIIKQIFKQLGWSRNEDEEQA